MVAWLAEWGPAAGAGLTIITLVALLIRSMRTMDAVSRGILGEPEQTDKSGAVIQEARPGILARQVKTDKVVRHIASDVASMLPLQERVRNVEGETAAAAAELGQVKATVSGHTTQIAALTDALGRNHPHDPVVRPVDPIPTPPGDHDRGTTS